MHRIDAGQVMGVVAELRGCHEQRPDDRLRLNADYFERNRDSVAYAEYRAKGWSQASSEVESAHRHVVQQRMKIPGAWWHPDNVLLNAAQQVATRSRCSAPGARREAGGGRGFVPHGSEERKRSGGAGGPGRIPG